MDTATREKVRQEKAARRETQEEQRQRQLVKEHEAWQREWDKNRAVLAVEAAAQEAAARLDVGPSKWVSEGTVEWACNYTGPHHGFWCLFHGRKRVTLIKIPGARGGCRHNCSSGSYYVNYMGTRHMSLYLGSDGNVYRYGHTKIFRAKLMDRKSAKSIRALVPKLGSME